MNFTVKEAAAVFGQPIENETPLASVEFDSRLIKENSLFVPLAGTRDGHCGVIPPSNHRKASL